jgi:TRAP-type mannitol/chloroaromatic compound transport system substrate-binding protein
MNTEAQKINYSPAIILALVAAVVLLFALLVVEKSADEPEQLSTSEASVQPQKIYQWRMVTTWPKNFPGLGSAAENFAQYVNEASGGRLQVKVFGGGQLVPALGVFDAVSSGAAEMGHSAAYYWKGKIPASPFFTSVPFGMNAQEMNGWLRYGGGLELWRELYEPFDLIPFPAGNTGVQMAGWFNKEINTVDDIKGLKMRIPGLAGEVWNRAGGTAVNIPGGELYTSLQTGVIDAVEWVGPYNDLAFGFQQIAKHYYYPGWHEPGPTLELMVNKTAYESLPEDLQQIIDKASRAVNQDMLDEYTARNNSALQELVEVHGVKVERLPQSVIDYLKVTSDKMYADMSAKDESFARIYQHYREFAEGAQNYHKLSEQSYYDARD